MKTKKLAMLEKIMLDSDASDNDQEGPPSSEPTETKDSGYEAEAPPSTKPKTNCASLLTTCSGCVRVGLPPPLLLKTYEIVEDPETDPIISWNSTGTSFVIWNEHLFAASVLPQFFGHRNIANYICQLYTYCFKKISWSRCEFMNENFLKGKPHLLKHIKLRSKLPPKVQQPREKEPAMDGTSVFDTEKELEILTREHDILKEELMKLKERQETLEKESISLTNRAVNDAIEIQKLVNSSLKTVLAKKGQVGNNEGSKRQRVDEEQSIIDLEKPVEEVVKSPERVHEQQSIINLEEPIQEVVKSPERVDEEQNITELVEPVREVVKSPERPNQDQGATHWIDVLMCESSAEKEEKPEELSRPVIELEDLFEESSDWAEYVRELQEKPSEPKPGT